jgi:hypothetical protein
LAWLFVAAPEERLISVFGRLQSSWPAHGSVIVKNDEACFTAGSSSYLNGGIHYYRLDLLSGKVLATGVVTHIDPETERQTVEAESRFDSVGVASDILSSDGQVVFLKHLQIDDSGQHSPAPKPHLFSPTSLLEEKWFVRSYWTYATRVEGAGYGGWARTANNNPAGRILTFTDDTVYGYGRIAHQAARTGHRSNKYHLYASAKEYERPKAPDRKGTSKKTERKRLRTPPITKNYKWSVETPFTVRAMVATPGTLLVAGVPDVGRRLQASDRKSESEKFKAPESENPRLEFENPVEAVEAFRGQHGSFLRLVSTENGKLLKEIALGGIPVNDGMSVANGKLFISLKDGSVVCY